MAEQISISQVMLSHNKLTKSYKKRSAKDALQHLFNQMKYLQFCKQKRHIKW